MYSYMQLSKVGRETIGHHLENFVKSCTFGGLDCEIDKRQTNGYKRRVLNYISRTFETYFNPFYGDCFVFNFNSNESASESSVLPGPGYGLSLVLNLELEHYRTKAEAEGVR